MSSTDNFDFYTIDINRLDEAWVEHVRVHHEIADHYCEAHEDHERAKVAVEIAEDELKQVFAEQYLQVKKHPSNYGFEKAPTEESVKSTVLIQPAYRTAFLALIEAKQRAVGKMKDLDEWKNALGTMDHRKKGLEDLVTLQGRDYYAAPHERGGKHQMAKAETESAFGRKRKLNEHRPSDK
ncbi:MAG: hypothetical protein KGL39_00930 [Patescibacteria group bacterium]|nr:hypothetical protein [Patescibacteria group bacterium]